MKYKLLSWDYKDSPPWGRINELIQAYPKCHIEEVETGGDDNCIVVSDGALLPTAAQHIYDEMYG